MSDDRFGKWWPCLRKHHKRLTVWLPHARRLRAALKNRSFRYFTLCARPMIDVYMLVKEKIVELEPKTRRVQGVSFCECDHEIFPEMIELIGVEEAGFLAQLEDLVLFADIPETQTLDSHIALTQYLEEGGEGIPEAIRAKVQEKMRHLNFQRLFPFDFLNLDFCDRYYGDPPDVMKIHATIDKLLDWQRRPGQTTSGKEFGAERFVMAITCRVDLKTPPEARARLKQIVAVNSDENEGYREALVARSIGNLESWATQDPVDFFMSAWPKEIARLAKNKSWDITVHDHAFYDRQNEKGETYHMVCLVVEFTPTLFCETYLSAVTKCLDAAQRKFIPRFDDAETEGKKLVASLRLIVALRNKQAKAFARDLLPDPLEELVRLRAEGVPI